MTQQYLRAWSLVVGTVLGAGIDLSALHFKFVVRQRTIETPAHAEIVVYNLSRSTREQLDLAENSIVELQAGYGDAMGLIFRGTIIQKRVGKENATDSFLTILATNNDEPYNGAITSRTLSAGYTAGDVHAALASDFGVDIGYAPDFFTAQGLRGKVLYGRTKDVARFFADTHSLEWSFATDGSLQLLFPDFPLPGEAIELTSKTGMLGLPTLTIDGLLVKALLNPQIHAGRQIHIDNASVQLPANSPNARALNAFPSTDADGYYRVGYVTHTGDTRGTPWYTEMICSAVVGTPPKSSVFWITGSSNAS